MRPEGLCQRKKSNDTIGNRIRDLPACSAVRQPTAPPRAPMKAGRNRIKPGNRRGGDWREGGYEATYTRGPQVWTTVDRTSRSFLYWRPRWYCSLTSFISHSSLDRKEKSSPAQQKSTAYHINRTAKPYHC